MHIFGKSDPIAMASAIHDALALTKTPVNTLISAQPTNNSLAKSYAQRNNWSQRKIQ